MSQSGSAPSWAWASSSSSLLPPTPQVWAQGNSNVNTTSFNGPAPLLPQFQSTNLQSLVSASDSGSALWTNATNTSAHVNMSTISFDTINQSPMNSRPLQNPSADFSRTQSHTQFWPAPSPNFISAAWDSLLGSRSTHEFASVASALGLNPFDAAVDSLLKANSVPPPPQFPLPQQQTLSVSQSLQLPAMFPRMDHALSSHLSLPEPANDRKSAPNQFRPLSMGAGDWPEIIPSVQRLAPPSSSPALTVASSGSAVSSPETVSDAADATSVSSPPANAKRKRLQSKRACVPCRLQKTACGSVRPCGRCTRLGKAHLCVDHVPKKRTCKKKPARTKVSAVDSSPLQLPESSSSQSLSSKAPSSSNEPPSQSSASLPAHEQPLVLPPSFATKAASKPDTFSLRQPPSSTCLPSQSGQEEIDLSLLINPTAPARPSSPRVLQCFSADSTPSFESTFASSPPLFSLDSSPTVGPSPTHPMHAWGACDEVSADPSDYQLPPRFLSNSSVCRLIEELDYRVRRRDSNPNLIAGTAYILNEMY